MLLPPNNTGENKTSEKYKPSKNCLSENKQDVNEPQLKTEKDGGGHRNLFYIRRSYA